MKIILDKFTDKQIVAYFKQTDPMTVCEIYLNERLITFGVARRRDEDEPSRYVGYKQAFTSALLRRNMVTGKRIVPKFERTQYWKKFFGEMDGARRWQSLISGGLVDRIQYLYDNIHWTPK